jgi:hypothetical protein
MGKAQLFEQVPLWAIMAGTVVIVLASIQGGLLTARLQRGKHDKEEAGPIGSVVGATLALLAFMLAFTFGIAASRREMRRDLLLEEVNAIGTTYLRAGLIPEPQRSEVRAMLRTYVDLRLDAYDHPERIPVALDQSQELQKRLWSHATALAEADLKNPDIVSLFVDSLNQMIELQTKRVTVGRYRIPTVIWTVFGIWRSHGVFNGRRRVPVWSVRQRQLAHAVCSGSILLDCRVSDRRSGPRRGRMAQNQ